MTVCAGPECERAPHSRGLCPGHYAQMRRGGGLSPLRRHHHRGAPCRICGDPSKAVGLCSRHYQRNAKGQLIDAGRRNRPKGSGSIDKRTGYKTITVAGVRWLEHRYVMSQALGRPLRDDEEVHHRNGRKADNRLANLEVWVTSQPAGQRPEDLVAYVVRYYPDLVREALR